MATTVRELPAGETRDNEVIKVLGRLATGVVELLGYADETKFCVNGYRGVRFICKRLYYVEGKVSRKTALLWFDMESPNYPIVLIVLSPDTAKHVYRVNQTDRNRRRNRTNRRHGHRLEHILDASSDFKRYLPSIDSLAA